MKPKNLTQRLGIWAIIVAGILTIPYITNAPWTSLDYVLAGAILFGAASTYEFLTKSAKNKKHNALVALLVLVVLILIQYWAVS